METFIFVIFHTKYYQRCLYTPAAIGRRLKFGVGTRNVEYQSQHGLRLFLPVSFLFKFIDAGHRRLTFLLPLKVMCGSSRLV